MREIPDGSRHSANTKSSQSQKNDLPCALASVATAWAVRQIAVLQKTVCASFIPANLHSDSPFGPISWVASSRSVCVPFFIQKGSQEISRWLSVATPPGRIPAESSDPEGIVDSWNLSGSLRIRFDTGSAPFCGDPRLMSNIPIGMDSRNAYQQARFQLCSKSRTNLPRK